MDMKRERLEHALGYRFKDSRLLERALTHPSFSAAHNQRLEFLGDAILGFIISEQLYTLQPQANEGNLSRMRSSLIRREALAELAHRKQLIDYLRIGPGETKPGDSSLADMMEAIIAAIYLDDGLESCKNCVVTWYHDMITNFSDLKPVKDAKSRLQEWLQAKKYALPCYELSHNAKSDADSRFIAICTVDKLPYRAKGSGRNRRQAEQIAAQHYLEQLRDQH